MTTTDTPGNKCLVCGYLFDATSSVYDDHKPGEGDISICLNCGAALIFTKDLKLRFPTPEEKAYITMDTQVLRAQIVRAHVVTEDLLKKQRQQHGDAGPPSPSAIKLAERMMPPKE